MIITYETFQAAQLLKKYGFPIKLSVAQQIGEIIVECGVDAVDKKLQAKKDKKQIKKMLDIIK